MKLTDMKKVPEKDDKGSECCGIESDEKYPWGLELNLDEESLSKLGIKDLPAIGEELMLEAKVSVTRMSSSEEMEGGERRSLSLQIKQMGIGGIKTDRVKALYDKEE